MAATIWFKFYPSDYESDPALKQCSLACQGLWMRMICVCARSDEVGFLTIGGVPLDLDGIAKIGGFTVAEVEPLVAELERWKVFSRDRRGRIYSRRMVRDAQKSKEGKKHGKKGGNPNLCKQTENVVTLIPLDKGGGYTQKPDTRNQIDSSLRSESNARAKPPDDEFNVWYEKYPNKVGKGAAVKAFKLARKKVDLHTLLDGVAQYVATKPCERNWCNPATCLNEERWLDKPAKTGRKNSDGDVMDAIRRL